MNNKIVVSTVLVGVIAILLAGLWSTQTKNSLQFNPIQVLPWQIDHTTEGAIRVFGLTLGRSTLTQAEGILHAEDEVSLFVTPAGKFTVEGYFDSVSLGGLDARVIGVVAVPTANLQELYNRGTRISTLGDGTHKVNLSSLDLLRIRDLPLASVTYIPKIKLNPAQIEHRFGKPKLQFRELEANLDHWLYPEQGLDIALGGGFAVFQYVLPSNFSSVLEPLTRQRGKTVTVQ